LNEPGYDSGINPSFHGFQRDKSFILVFLVGF